MANKKEINIEIGARVKHQRERAGFTQEKFAELLEMETNSISALECGAVGMSLTTVKKICILLSISADELLFDITPDNNADIIASRLRTLSPNQFKLANDMISKLLEAFRTK